MWADKTEVRIARRTQAALLMADDVATVEYVRILHLAASPSERAVESALASEAQKAKTNHQLTARDGCLLCTHASRTVGVDSGRFPSITLDDAPSRGARATSE